jgi:Domain of unknown function (DUF1990)
MGVQTTEDKDVQTIADGSGPGYHRVYSVTLPITFERALQTMAQLQSDINAFSPSWIAVFEKQKGDPKKLAVGDEILVRITGPWNGPIRVTEVGPDRFSFVTLEGHIEAGAINFRIEDLKNGQTRFAIESITRSRDQIVNFFYDKIRMAMLAQTEMWELFCQNFAKAAIGDEKAKATVDVKTERQDAESGLWVDISDEFGTHGTESVTEPD